MGDKAYLRVAGYTFLTFEGDLDPAIVMLFSESERPVAALESGEAPCVFRAPVWKIRDRLRVLGFTAAGARTTLQRWVKVQLDWSAQHGGLDQHLVEKPYEECSTHEIGRKTFAEQYAALRLLTFDTWLDAVRELVRYNIHNWEERERAPNLGRVAIYMINRRDETLGFARCDKRLLLRAFVCAVGEDAVVELDATEIYKAGVRSSVSITRYYRDRLLRDYPSHRNTIILTEGSSDIAVLQTALECIYPHLVDYFTFFDFHSTNAMGSAGALAATVKAFIASGIGDRFIAIFDNDTAGSDAMRGLGAIDIPLNCQILQYPDIEIAKDYPTLGPSGQVSMNVNGLAGGIELYLGRDVLTNDDGSLAPVQWRGYVDAVGQYQGEVHGKNRVRDRFFQQVKAWQAAPNANPERDWSGLKAIWDKVCSTFGLEE